jgi:hypothetical protein
VWNNTAGASRPEKCQKLARPKAENNPAKAENKKTAAILGGE